MSKVVAQRKLKRIVGDRKVCADLRLHTLGEQRPYFSATGTIYERRGNGRWVEASGGAIGEEIVRFFPNAKVVVDVHLADEHGAPMQAVANAVYWAGLASMPPDDSFGRTPLETDSYGTWSPATLARHLRVDVEEARRIRQAVIVARNLSSWESGPTLTAQAAMEAVLAAYELPQRWQGQADAALAYLRGEQ